MPLLTHEELGKLVMPILFIGGENDALLLFPKSKTLVLENTGHVLIKVVNSIISFLED